VKRVLVVDDDRAFLALMRDWLASAGHSVVALSDFYAAKNYLACNRPEAIVADVRIGAHNGLQLLAFTKHDAPDVVAVCVTGFDDQVLRAEAARIGAHYVLKPLTSRDLLALLE
jgi:DNA-binding response OmpR family regulator